MEICSGSPGWSSPANRLRTYGSMASNVTPVPVGGELAFCRARVVPEGKRLSGVTTKNWQRLQTGSVLDSHWSYAPEVSPIPNQNCDIWCQFAEPVANCCGTQETSHAPAGGGFIVMLRLLVRPLGAA